MNRHRALAHCLSMFSAQTLRVCREGKPLHTFPDHALNRFAAFHHVDFEACGSRMRRRDVDCTEQKVLEIEREKPDGAASQLFPPTHDLMRIGEIPLYLPNASCVFGAIDRATGIPDDLESSLVGDLEPVSYQ